MPAITPFAAGSYITNRSTSQLLGLKNQLNDLSTQLSTGLTAQTYGGLGTGRSAALAAQATLSALNGYASGIAAAQTRTNLAVPALTQIATLGASTLTTLNNGLQSSPKNATASQSIAMSNFQTALDMLNQSAAGNYLFGGSNSTTQPVLDANTILNGTRNSDGTTKQAGLKDLIAEQSKTDLGTGYGRLVLTSPGNITPDNATLGTNQVSIIEDPIAVSRANFGFLISGSPTTTGTAIRAQPSTAAEGSPNSFTLTVDSQPSVGDTISFTLQTHDGLTTTLTLTAATSVDSNSTNSFAIGTSKEATASNLSATIKNALSAAANSTLSVSSTKRAAQNFFSGSADAGVIPQRIGADAQGNPVYVGGAADNTMLWYQGEDGNSDARNSQLVQMSATSSIGVGARANEVAIQNVLSGLATVALGLPGSSGLNSSATYQAVVSSAGKLLSSASTSPSVQDIVTELSTSAAQLSNASARNSATQNTLQNVIGGIEQAPTEQVVAKLLDVQNRLQASYQLTSSLSKLSLVNYIS